MKFENTIVRNFDIALRIMKNYVKNYDKSDSGICKGGDDGIQCENCSEQYCNHSFDHKFKIGKNDMVLAQKLIMAGSEHRKFMHQIFVSVDITAPLYWWKEFDTYKVGTVASSCSTMHKLANTPITLECFETDDLSEHLIWDFNSKQSYGIQSTIVPLIESLESLRKKYLETKDKKYWKELIRWLPESWLQKRTVTMSYENLLTICSKGERRFYELNEWSGQNNSELPNFISWARTLPYAQELIFIDELEIEMEE